MTRTTLTSDEHVKLNESGTEFCRRIAVMTATLVAEFPSDIEDTVVTYLQDQTSLYSRRSRTTSCGRRSLDCGARQ